MVGANAGRLPARVVTRGIGLVQLEAVEGVPSDVDERDTKGTETWVSVSFDEDVQ
jgi:hypothetical protein